MSAEEPTDPTAEPATDLSQEPGDSDAPTTDAASSEAAQDPADASESPEATDAEPADPATTDLSETPAPTDAPSDPDASRLEDPETATEASDEAQPEASDASEALAPTDATSDPDASELDDPEAATEAIDDAEPDVPETPAEPEPTDTTGDPTTSESDPTNDLDSPASESANTDTAKADAPEARADPEFSDTAGDPSTSESDPTNDIDSPAAAADPETPAGTDPESTADDPYAPLDPESAPEAFTRAVDDDDSAGALDPEDPLVAMLAELDAPRRPAPAGVQLSEELPIDPEDDLRGVEGEASLRLVSILESLLFAAARPLKVQDLRRILAETSKHQIQLALAHLMAITRDRGVVLAQVAGGFQFRTHPENAVWVQKMLQSKPARLSRTQIETLAIVAYRQPITRPEIDDVRGVDSGAVLKGLLERELVQIVGRKEEPGRPLLYGTTVKFLEFFNLRGLRDLPTLRDFRDLSEESKATLRTQLGASEAEALGQGVLGFPAAAAEETADMQQPFDEMPSGNASDFTDSSASDFTAGGSSDSVGDPPGPSDSVGEPPEQTPTPMELPGDPAPDELVPPAPERLPQPGPDEIRPPDPGTDSPARPDEWQAPGPDIADVPGVDPGQGEPEV